MQSSNTGFQPVLELAFQFALRTGYEARSTRLGREPAGRQTPLHL